MCQQQVLVGLRRLDPLTRRSQAILGGAPLVPSSRNAVGLAAREAIEHVEDLARRQVPHARSWVRSSELADADLLALTNAGLLARDRVIGRWSPRVRRLVAGRLAGATQLELAEREEISQSAVSQTLAAAGATAITAGYESLVDGS